MAADKRGIETKKRKISTPAAPFLFLVFVVSSVLTAGFLFGQAAPAKRHSARERVDLLVAGGTVVTMDAGRRVLEDGAVAVRGDTIVAVGARAELEAKYVS